MLRLFSQYVSGKTVLLMILESMTIALSLVCAVQLRFWDKPAELASYVAFPDFGVQLSIVVVVCLICFYCNDLYTDTGFTSMDGILRIEQSLGTASLLLGLLYFMFPELLLSRGVFLIGMLLAAAFVLLGRKFLDFIWRLTAPVHQVAILGTGSLALTVAHELATRGDLNIKLRGFLQPTSADPPADDFKYPVLGSVWDVETVADRFNLSRIIVALEDSHGTLPIRELVTLRVRGMRVEDATTALSSLTGRVSLQAVKPSWFVFSDGFRRSTWNEALKRVLDLFASLTGLVLSAPVMVLIAAAIRLDSEGPALYRQTRVGRKNKTFELLKFRSMNAKAEQGGAQWASLNDPRVTRIGRVLRKYRLDELPQFINVIRGDMSFVGPRPERPCFVEELRKQIPYYDERHSIRPGITGWAQVCYAYGSGVEDAARKLEYDLFYLKNVSISFDLAIVFRTIRIVIGGHGAR